MTFYFKFLKNKHINIYIEHNIKFKIKKNQIKLKYNFTKVSNLVCFYLKKKKIYILTIFMKKKPIFNYVIYFLKKSIFLVFKFEF